MIRISKPWREERGGQTYLLSHVVDETRQWDNELWFSVNPEYGAYLCDDYADAFVLVALLPAIKSGQDIEVEGRMSRKLLFNLRTTVIPIFTEVFRKEGEIRIEAQAADDILYHGKGVGCGCSLGVDSLSAFYEHFNPETTEGYRVTHLTLFNSGQLGDIDLAAGEENFRKSVEELAPFAAAVGLPILAVNSNMNDFFLWSGVILIQSFVLRTCACAMALQKLLGRYVYATTGIPLTDFKFNRGDTAYMESAYVPLMSTENFELMLSNPMKSRLDKTDDIRRNPLTEKFLQVCWAECSAWNRFHITAYLEGKTKTNCGWCPKCFRTLIALELLEGDLSRYAGIFHLSKYEGAKDRYIREMFQRYRREPFYQDIIELMIEKRYPLPPHLLEQYRREQAGLPPRKRLRDLAGKVRKGPRRIFRAAKRRLGKQLERYAWFRRLRQDRAARCFLLQDAAHTAAQDGKGGFREEVRRAIRVYLPDSPPLNSRRLRKLERDIAKCHLRHRCSPAEYFMFGFPQMDESGRTTFATEKYVQECIARLIDPKLADRELNDRAAFHRRAGSFFMRDACVVRAAEDWEGFRRVAGRRGELAATPLPGSFGPDTILFPTHTEDEARLAFNTLLERGVAWFVEEPVHRGGIVRLPSFRTEQGYKLMTPVLITPCSGGKGSIFANIDKGTGVVQTDGVRDDGKVLARHPESGAAFKGTSLPGWEALLETAGKVHALFPPHRYLAMDFARTETGWVLTAGSHAALGSQFAARAGCRAEWDEYMVNQCSYFIPEKG